MVLPILISVSLAPGSYFCWAAAGAAASAVSASATKAVLQSLISIVSSLFPAARARAALRCGARMWIDSGAVAPACPVCAHGQVIARALPIHDDLSILVGSDRNLTCEISTAAPSFLLGLERPGAIADDARTVACRISRVAQRQPADLEPAPLGLDQEAGDRQEPAGATRAERRGIATLDRSGRLEIQALRLPVLEVVRQVGTDDHERVRTTPQPREEFGDLTGGGLADDERDQRKRGKDLLQERKLDLEGMFWCMRRVGLGDERQV